VLHHHDLHHRFIIRIIFVSLRVNRGTADSRGCSSYFRSRICYFSSGTSLPDQSDLSGLLTEDYGNSIPDWPDERWLGLRSERVWNVMVGRITLAAQKAVMRLTQIVSVSCSTNMR
jgi:hypothetical protein